MYLATERGYFAQEGISPQFITFDGAAQAVPALATGQIDIGAGALSAALFNAINRGLNIRVVAPQSENRGCDHSSTWILVRKDLADSGAIRTPADLRGRKIALSSTAGSSEYMADTLLRQGSLESSTVEYVQMAFGDMGAALAGGKIDVAVGAEPTATSFVDRGVAIKWLCGADILPNNQFTYLMYSGDFADKHTEIAQHWMRAYLRAARDWQHMLETGEDRDGMLSVLTKYTPVRDLMLLERISLPVPAADERVDATNIQDQMRWMHDRTYLSQVPGLDQIVDTRFIDSANQSVGAQP
jgi:NitT/TauT family transport system substrate-binding protein